jgi:hypothetical protein
MQCNENDDSGTNWELQRKRQSCCVTYIICYRTGIGVGFITTDLFRELRTTRTVSESHDPVISFH